MKLVEYFHDFLQSLYLKIEKRSLLYSRNFSSLGYLEKLFLSVFHRDDLFMNSLANVTNEQDIYDYRVRKYPKLFFYHVFMEKSDFDFDDLKFFVKQYKFVKSSKFFRRYKVFLYILLKKKTFKTNFVEFLVFQDLVFKQFFNNIDYAFFYEQDISNLLTHNFLTYMLLHNCKMKLYFFNLDYYKDWYEYSFNPNLIKKKKKPIFSRFSLIFKKYLRLQRKYDFYKNIYSYFIALKLNKVILAHHMNFSKALKIIFNKNHKVDIKKNFSLVFKNLFTIKFKDSSNIKNVNYNNIKNFSFFYIRKNRIFNKGRYSRNRQLYRTGVYWCLWLNIIIVYGLYFLFYRFTFNFGYIWLGMFFLILSTIIGRAIKYNFHNVMFLRKELTSLKIWLYYISLNIVSFLENLFYEFFQTLSFSFYLYKQKKLKSEENTLVDVLFYIFKKTNLFFEEIKHSKRIYIWEIMLEKDDSLFRYKTVFHVLKQIYKSITY